MWCKACDNNFGTFSQFLQHFKASHKKEGIIDYVCPYECDRVYSTISSLKKHIKMHLKQHHVGIELANEGDSDENENEEELSVLSEFGNCLEVSIYEK